MTTDPSLAKRDPRTEGAASPPPGGAGSEARPRSSLGTGVVPQTFARIDWASLIRRVFLEDVLRCPCGGRRRILSDVTEPDAVVAILEHLDRLAEHRGRGRRPGPGRLRRCLSQALAAIDQEPPRTQRTLG